MAIRAAGYRKKIIIIQFIKGSWKTGEEESLKKFYPQIKFVRTGEGFVKIVDDQKPIKAHILAAQKALKLAQRALCSRKYQIVILDEVNYAVKGNLIGVKDILNLIQLKPPTVHLVLTGNFASPKVVQKADLVTEMKEIKHPFKKGIKAQRGVDY